MIISKERWKKVKRFGAGCIEISPKLHKNQCSKSISDKINGENCCRKRNNNNNAGLCSETIIKR